MHQGRAAVTLHCDAPYIATPSAIDSAIRAIPLHRMLRRSRETVPSNFISRCLGCRWNYTPIRYRGVLSLAAPSTNFARQFDIYQ